MKKIILIRRYSEPINQEFFDLEFARLDQEREKEILWEREQITRMILSNVKDNV